ncbi:hypothetical protein ACWF76_14445 [Streptomyces globisporus]
MSVALPATGTSTAMADGDGDCTNTGNICVFNQQQPTGYHNGYYELNDPHPNFHGKYYLIKRAFYDNNDEFSSFRKTGC